MTKTKVIVKKYGNRRMYDTNASRYVNLEDIARMIREGADVEVIDAQTGKDLTRMILTQIIVEENRNVESGLPLGLLRQLVVASDRATHEFISSYLDEAVGLYQKAQEGIRARLSDAKTAASNPLEFLRHLVGGEPTAASHEALEIEELRRRVLELEARLAELRPRARRQPVRGARRTKSTA